VSSYLDPLRRFVDNTTDCPNNPICSPIQKLVAPIDDAVAGTNQLASGATKLADGSAHATAALGGTTEGVATMRASLRQLRELINSIRDTVATISQQFRQMTDYLTEVSTDFDRSGEGGFYLPARTFSDPALPARHRPAIFSRRSCNPTARLR
jgi:RND superfamily putative drug exporter